MSGQVDFHVGVADPFSYAARVVRKALAAGHRVALRAAPATHQRLGAALWAVSPTDFLAHVSAQSTAAPSCAVLLCGLAPEPQAGSCGVLINLDASLPENAAEFARVIEVLGEDEEEKRLGRIRYKQYREAGYALAMHTLESDS